VDLDLYRDWLTDMLAAYLSPKGADFDE